MLGSMMMSIELIVAINLVIELVDLSWMVVAHLITIMVGLVLVQIIMVFLALSHEISL